MLASATESVTEAEPKFPQLINPCAIRDPRLPKLSSVAELDLSLAEVTLRFAPNHP